MDKGIQAAQEANQAGNQTVPGDYKKTRRKPAGRQPNEGVDILSTASYAAGAVQRVFPGLNQRFSALPDPRRQDFCRYSGEHIWWAGVLMYLTRAGSRNAFDGKRNSGAAARNMGRFCGQTADDSRFEGEPLVTCSDNVAHHLHRVDATVVQNIPTEMCAELLKRRMFESARIFDTWYCLIFDGTVEAHCRKGFEEDGRSGGKGGYRYRYVLQCGVLGPGNTIFPLMHEHVDMHSKEDEKEKEDCEINAFFRLAGRLKHRFPNMKFCVIGDALFCAATVADVCNEYKWKYVLTLKEGRQPLIWDEVCNILPMCPENSLRVWSAQDHSKGLRDFRWVENLHLGQQSCTVVLAGEQTLSETKGTLYVYATNFLISKDRVLAIIPATGRERHHIEDYFNTGKNNGIGLGHVFCAESNASKNFFTLMQVAWILWTIICHGYLMRVFDWAARATEIALAQAIAEGMRCHDFPVLLPQPGQIRFVT